jgi:hypothetical protein
LPLELLMKCDGVAGTCATRSRQSAIFTTEISVQLDGGEVADMAGLHFCARK